MAGVLEKVPPPGEIHRRLCELAVERKNLERLLRLSMTIKKDQARLRGEQPRPEDLAENGAEVV